MTLPAFLVLVAGRLAGPLWIGYLLSAAWYIYQIISALDVRGQTQPPILFAREHFSGDIFALVGTFQWLVFGINYRSSKPAAVSGLVLAGLHLLLLAVRATIVPMLWILDQTAR